MHSLNQDFTNLVTCLANRIINPTDQPILSALDFARFRNLKDTRNMTYLQQSMDFWLWVLKLLGGPSLRLFSGPKGSGETNYDPNMCRINFAVPSLSTLLRQNTDIPKQIMPSDFMDIIENISLKQNLSCNEYILSYDGKGVAQGFRGPNFGDISLWGLEGPPTLEEEQKRLDEELKLSANLVTDIDEELLVSKRQFLQNLLFKVTSRIKQLRSIIKEQEKVTACCLKMKEKNPDYDLKYSSLSSAEKLILDCKLTVKKCLQLNREICLCSTALGGCRQFCSEGYHVEMSSQSNYKELMPPENIEHLLQYKENSVWVKQKSELWEQLRQYSVITGSTCSNAIGLTTLSD